MKKIIKVIIWTLAVILGLGIFGALIFLFNFIHATKAMTPAETEAINDSVWCIRDHYVNAYIFKDNSGFLMIDAGIGKKTVGKELDKLGIKPKKINAVFLTHTDADHIGGVGMFKNAIIYMNSEEEQMVSGKSGKSKYYKPKWNYGPYTLLHNNDTLNIGGVKIKILLTPGHTPGSSCYIIGNEYLATGDNLIIRNGKYEHFTEKFNMNTPQQIESIKTLPGPSTFRYILTAHYGIVKE
jgi:glyoxylase-like metal-dependent hydrolase (beta-lactamase superfamily II)